MPQRKKVTLGALAVVGAILYLVISGFSGNTGYEVSLTELVNSNEAYVDSYLQAQGRLVPETTQWDSRNVILRFTVTDGQVNVPVVYNGVKPDNFDYADAELIVSGYYRQGVLEAEKVETRCPTKYEAAAE